MRSVTYSMSVSLDGYIVGPDGSFNWPDRRTTHTNSLVNIMYIIEHT